MIVRANATASEQAALTDYIGQAYQLSDIPEIGDILSPVAPVAAWSRAFSEWGRSNPKPVTAQLERRQMGIIVHLQRLDEELLWAIAYHHLYIYHTELLSLHAPGSVHKNPWREQRYGTLQPPTARRQGRISRRRVLLRASHRLASPGCSAKLALV
jgi:hypothetical protein